MALPIIAVTSGTFDVLHASHLDFLKACHSLLPMGGKLYVLLTTDELARKQKRPPLFHYEHRRSLLMALPWVTDVLAHTGLSKVELYKRFPFHQVFIGEEYYGSQEYQDIQQHGIPVVYLPDPHNRALSSSQIMTSMTVQNVQKFRIIAEGTCGSVFLYDDKPSAVIVKSVRLSQVEVDGPRTANVYHLPFPRPRNWKRRGARHTHPMLPGVSGWRELDIQPFIQSFPWCSTFAVERNYERPTAPVHSPLEDYSHIKDDKTDARAVYFIYQYYRGGTLTDWIQQNQSPSQLQSIVDQVRQICGDLKAARVVHGDIHAANLCIQAKQPKVKAIGGIGPTLEWEVTLIDFGWCLHYTFHMEEGEQLEYRQHLETGWDWRHFTDSMDYMYGDEPWFKELTF